MSFFCDIAFFDFFDRARDGQIRKTDTAIFAQLELMIPLSHLGDLRR